MKKISTHYNIDICQRHIDHGEAKNCGKCPLALAIEEVIGVPCEVGPDSVFVFRPERAHQRGLLCGPAQNFVYRFDHGMSVEPIVFPLDLVGYEE